MKDWEYFAVVIFILVQSVVSIKMLMILTTLQAAL